ncbi:hypothetical protein BD309DRAFT_963520 [Dichomitus squalens]|nr:hypothetical protein BD309DRAFT_963520 [Dichomitus squalens]
MRDTIVMRESQKREARWRAYGNKRGGEVARCTSTSASRTGISTTTHRHSLRSKSRKVLIRLPAPTSASVVLFQHPTHRLASDVLHREQSPIPGFTVCPPMRFAHSSVCRSCMSRASARGPRGGCHERGPYPMRAETGFEEAPVAPGAEQDTDGGFVNGAREVEPGLFVLLQHRTCSGAGRTQKQVNREDLRWRKMGTQVDSGDLGATT